MQSDMDFHRSKVTTFNLRSTNMKCDVFKTLAKSSNSQPNVCYQQKKTDKKSTYQVQISVVEYDRLSYAHQGFQATWGELSGIQIRL